MLHMRQGFALPIVLIVTAVILASYVSIAALSAISARAATAGERASLQALLVSEAGIESFLAEYSALAAADRSLPALSVEALNAWLLDTELAMLALGDGVISRTVVAVSPARTAFTLRSRGVVGQSAATVLSEFRISTVEGRVNVNAPAALTSYPAVSTGRNIEILGVPLASVSPYRSGVTATDAPFALTLASTAPVTIELTNAGGDLLDPGDYVRIDGLTYRVESSTSASISATPLVGPPEKTVDANTPVEMVDVGLSTRYLSGNTLHVNRPERLAEGGKIRMGTFEGVVDDVAFDGTVTVTWNVPAPSGDFEEGTPLSVEVYGVYTAGSYSPHNNPKYQIAALDFADGANLPAPSPLAPEDDDRVDSLFYETFGVTKAAFLSSMPPENVVADKSGLPVPLGGQTFVVRDGNLQQALCGTGIVIVIASDVVYNSSSAAGCEDFRGLVYVIGDLRMQGNVNMVGAIVVEGLVTTVDETIVSGAGQDSRIQYDRNALLDAARAFPISGGLRAEAGTWRQQ